MQVVEAVVQSTRSPVVGAVANPAMVLEVVAPLAHVVVAVLLYSVSVPAVPDNPNVGVTVQEDAVALDVSGIAPEEGALVAFVPPCAMTSVELSPAAVPVVFWFSVGKFVKFAAEKVGAV